MKTPICLLAIVLASAAACGPPPEQALLESAVEAMGGRDHMINTRAFTIEGTASAPDIGHNRLPYDDPPLWSVTEFSRSIDLLHHEMRVRQIRTAQFPFVNAGTQQLDQALDDEVAFNRNPDGTFSRLPISVVRDRRIELLHHPLSLIWTAVNDPSMKLTGFRKAGAQRIVEMTTARGETVTIAFDATTKLPSRATSTTDDPNLGDVAIDTAFDGYEDVGGIKMPKHLRTTIDRYLRLDLQVSKNTFTVGDLTAPSLVFVAPADAPATTVTAESVAKGIWWLAGSGDHFSTLFEFDDHLVLFDVPVNEARSKAVIDKARTLSSKPLTQVIVPQHDFDHSGGLRVAVAQGLTVITYKDNIPFFKALCARRHSIVPDELALHPREPRFVAVDDSLTLEDNSMEVRLYHLLDNAREGTTLFAYVPRDRILVQADLYDSTWTHHPWGGNVIDNIEKIRKLNVDKQVPVHGAIQSYAEMVKTIRKAPNGGA